MLELDDEEKEFLKKEMEKIVEWVSKLEELDVGGEEFRFLANIHFREDEPKPTLKREDLFSKYNHDGIYFIVPKVVEK